MDTRRFSVTVSTCSVVLSLVDTYTGRPPLSGSYSVKVKGITSKPLYKSDGYVVFQDLPEQKLVFQVKSSYYSECSIELDWSRDLTDEVNGNIVSVPLSPSPTYPFATGTTLLRARLADGQGYARTGVTVAAQPLADACAKAKVGQGGWKKGATIVPLNVLYGRLFAGERLSILDGKSGETETVCLASIDEVHNRYILEQPLQRDYPRGTALLPVVCATSDDRGEWVIPFPPQLPGEFDIRISEESSESFKEVKISGGEMNYAGTIVW